MDDWTLYMKCLDYPLLENGESGPDSAAAEIERFITSNTIEDNMDNAQSDRPVDYYLTLIDSVGSPTKEKIQTFFESHQSMLYSVEICAPLRSICPDKRCSARFQE